MFKIFVLFFLVCFVITVLSLKWVKLTHFRVSFSDIKLRNSVKILHLSDIHGNSSHKMNVNIWKHIDTIDFDFVVITGDLFVGTPKQFAPHVPHLEALARRKKVYYTDGNHEKNYVDEVRQMLENLGVTVLYDEFVTFAINGADVTLVGLRDYYYAKENSFKQLHKLFELDELKQARENSITIVATHQPQTFDEILQYKPNLTLCGHTHGGQVRLPFLPVLYAPGQGFLPEYAHGLYRKQNAVLYVSKGIGTTHFPIRFLNRPEIAVVEIV